MSSATSIERTAARAADNEPRSRDTFRPWHFFVLASLITATAAVVMARQSRPENLVLISIAVGAAGFAAAALYRTLAPLVSDQAATAVEPLTEGMRAVLEREKQLTLRAIKDLEFDRAMGKLAQKDFDEMAGRLRARAMTLMKQLDAESGYRDLIERELSARLRTLGTDPARTRSSPGRREPRDAAESAHRICACGTVNDSDASFCKRCGMKLGGASAS